MEKIIYLMNSQELPTPGTHMFTTKKFISGFTYYGYETKIALQLDDITDGSIVLLSNHGIDNPTNSKDIGIKALNYLADKYPNTIFICWFYHRYYDIIPFKKYIITGEHFRFKPALEGHIKCWDLEQKINNYVPLTFASPLLPEQIGTFKRNESLNGCFMGTSYKYDWVAGLPKTVFLTGINHGREIEEKDRIELFLSSKIAFGFHHNNNVINNVIVERVFEGMAYGCVVISDSPAAGKITNGIVQVANNKEEFLNIYNRLLSNDNERMSLQEKGYEWVKQNGLYIHTVKCFLDKIYSLYNHK